MTDTALQQALAAAQANENRARESAEKAAGAVRSAQAARDALIGDAAAGKPVKAENVRAAEEATRAAEIDAEIAARVHSTALRLRHEAEIVHWHDEAAALDAKIHDAETARVRAGAKVDAAFIELKKAVDEFNVTGTDLWNAIAAAGAFNGGANFRKSRNSVLAAAEPGAAPAGHGNYGNYRGVNLNPIEAMVYNYGAPADFRGHVGSVAAREAATFRRPDLINSQPSKTI
jgi:hypothetical protein